MSNWMKSSVLLRINDRERKGGKLLLNSIDSPTMEEKEGSLASNLGFHFLDRNENKL